jgi:hypothetical protein
MKNKTIIMVKSSFPSLSHQKKSVPEAALPMIAGASTFKKAPIDTLHIGFRAVNLTDLSTMVDIPMAKSSVPATKTTQTTAPSETPGGSTHFKFPILPGLVDAAIPAKSPWSKMPSVCKIQPVDQATAATEPNVTQEGSVGIGKTSDSRCKAIDSGKIKWVDSPPPGTNPWFKATGVPKTQSTLKTASASAKQESGKKTLNSDDYQEAP